MYLFKKVAIIGIGLIGGSIALDMKRRGLSRQIVAVSRHRKTLSIALKIKAIDKGSLSLSIIKGADLVIIATPIDAIISLRKEILRHAGRNCIITDVGSTKEMVSKALGGLFPNYIGSHPLAGSEKRGIKNASCGIFRDSLCVITAGKNSAPGPLKKIRKLWLSLGARVVILDPGTHDKLIGFSSHLPHAVAFSLINSLPEGASRFSAKGLKDTTRIAASDAHLWKGIFLSNGGNLLKAIAVFERNLNKLKLAVKNKDSVNLRNILSKAQKRRELLE